VLPLGRRRPDPTPCPYPPLFRSHPARSAGGTPARTYELLGADGGDWAGIEVWFADERCVAPDDKDSNSRLAAETLLGPAGIAARSEERRVGDKERAEAAARSERS